MSARIQPINDLQRHTKSLLPELEQAATTVLRSGWFVNGQALQAFESQFSQYCGVKHCVGVGNGTDSLELALKSVGVEPGDKVITVANAGMYSTTAILAIGAFPFYIDVEPDTMLLDVPALTRAIHNESPKAVIVTHLYGRMAAMEEILSAARASNTRVVEDCAQAHGAGRNDRKAGSYGDIGCFSFYPTKNLGALGDGGAVVTNSDVLAEKVCMLRQYGWGNKYDSQLFGGRNSRLDEIQAAMLSVKLAHLDRWNERRREIARLYGSIISNKRVVCPKFRGTEYVAHLYVVRTPDRDDLQRHLKATGVQSEVHYPIPDHEQTSLPSVCRNVCLTETEELSKTVLTLPCFPEMTDGEVKYVAEITNSW